jgi:tRNA (cmo5U34)-methyltransferase
MAKDTIYSTQQSVGDFQFDETVAQVFPDMIKRSVPGYSHIIANTGVIAKHFAKPHSNIYDLGSSLGATTLAMRQCVQSEDVTIIAVDNSAAMIKRSQDYLQMIDSPVPVKSICANVQDIDIQNASFIAMNFTLQFIKKDQRSDVIEQIYAGLNDGGALVLSEKLVFDDEDQQSLLENLQLDFKRANGYSELEISQKRSAIENVMVPETYTEHKQRLYNAGFKQVDIWFQCFNFASIVAIK